MTHHILTTALKLYLRSGVNFINVVRAAFLHADAKSAKKTVKLSVFFALLGSVRIKAASRTLMKLTPHFMSSNEKKLLQL